MAESGSPPPERLRVDKWLWAARFFKTRALAAEAVQGGKVHVNGARVKASRPLKPGDRLRIHKGDLLFEIEVLRLAARRGPASVAATLYAEDPASLAAREARREERRLQAAAQPQGGGRPDKKARRQWRRVTGRG
ncbi:RNA-binding S4 domain-containing protein [Thiohalobacter sp. IOR34]|uniref:RNA-binding S4 domain-containing protein n=1 Tax=Thiohalobacter sp. IOR34 TaxID=3057176 RepID=UPI0025B172CA|nr:RNA-binding S4 domain-containing protein [Thiohalobacter sp. IOR34]WJW74771.1 RNA-binding S4 domain-containing protein [Thiohalobacter sp. IOR34]